MRIILKPLGATALLIAVVALIVIAVNASQNARIANTQLKKSAVPSPISDIAPPVDPMLEAFREAVAKGGTETVFNGKKKAVRAADFLDSVGVGVHWGYEDTPYGFQYAAVRDKLIESGIRHMRTGIAAPVEPSRISELARRGVRSLVILGPETGTLYAAHNTVKTINAEAPGAILGIEGPNEPDLFWSKSNITYPAPAGDTVGKTTAKGFPEGLIAYQTRLFKQFKTDPATKSLIVVGPGLGKTYDAGNAAGANPLRDGKLKGVTDFGNFHPYPGGNTFSVPFAYGTIEKYLWTGTHPSANIDEFPYAFEQYGPAFGGRPMIATETGYSTCRSESSERAHGKYVPRLFLEYFLHGVRRTYLYEFVDERNNPDDRESCFGLLRSDLSPKPGYTALKNLLGLLADSVPSGKFGATREWDYTVKASPSGEWNRLHYVHHLLLEKSNGEAYLILWHEVAIQDSSVSPWREIAVPPLPATVTVRTAVKPEATVFEWDDAGEMRERNVTLTAGTLNVAVQDRITVVRLTPAVATGE